MAEVTDEQLDAFIDNDESVEHFSDEVREECYQIVARAIIALGPEDGQWEDWPSVDFTDPENLVFDDVPNEWLLSADDEGVQMLRTKIEEMRRA